MSQDPWRAQYCIEIFLPLRRGDGAPVSRTELDEIKHRLTDRFGGVTAFLQSPAEGLWDEGGDRDEDRVVVLEVMADTLDGLGWSQWQAEFERRFQQEEILIRATAVSRLGR